MLSQHKSCLQGVFGGGGDADGEWKQVKTELASTTTSAFLFLKRQQRAQKIKYLRTVSLCKSVGPLPPLGLLGLPL